MYVPYTAEHVITKFQLLLFAGAVFFIFLPLLKRKHVISLDTDWFYRRLLSITAQWVVKRLLHISQALQNTGGMITLWLSEKFKQYQANNDHLLAKNSQSAVMTIWLTALLAFILFVYY